MTKQPKRPSTSKKKAKTVIVEDVPTIERERDKNRYKYRVEIQQMMFVSGEINDPPERTTDLIEDIVKDQVISMMVQAQKSASNRGQKSVLPEDLIFLIRHDKAKVNRLRTYLSWKDVRKNAKEQEADLGGDMMDESVDGKMVKQKKSQIKLPWELEFVFSEHALLNDDDDVDEEEREAVLAQIKRLRQNDERTRNMTQQEYVHWSECRQASFTFRKGKRFREWCGLANITEGKPNDDVIDILGFLTFEMVCTITEEALKIKKKSDDHREQRSTRKFLFMEPSEQNKPIQMEHVIEAWRMLQEPSYGSRSLYNFRGGRLRGRVRLI
ncbi:transcriptional regulator [Martiniozyma asiatica (nom. inval.)]|nr:transcriptional regulator [Martiniozyma asiatica]